MANRKVEPEEKKSLFGFSLKKRQQAELLRQIGTKENGEPNDRNEWLVKLANLDKQ